MSGMNIPMMRATAGSIDDGDLERVADSLDADMSDLRAGRGLTRRDTRRIRRECDIPNSRTAEQVAAAAYLRAGATGAAVDLAHGECEAFPAVTDADVGDTTPKATDAATGRTDGETDETDAARADGGTGTDTRTIPGVRGADGVMVVEGDGGGLDLLRIDGSPEGVRNLREQIPSLADATDDEAREAFDRYREWYNENREQAATLGGGLTNAVLRGVTATDTDEQRETTDHETDETMTTTDFSDDAEELAEAVLRAEDIHESNDKNLTAAEYLAGKYRLDASEYDDRYRLRRHVTDAKNDIPPAEQTVDAKPGTADEHLSDFAEQQETGSAVGEPTAADKLAKDHMLINELRGAIDAGRSPAEHIAAEYDIDAGEYVGADHGDDDAEGLRGALADARGRVDLTGLPGHRGGHTAHTTDMDGASDSLSPSNPGGVGQPYGLRGPTKPRNPHVSPREFDSHGSNADGDAAGDE